MNDEQLAILIEKGKQLREGRNVEFSQEETDYSDKLKYAVTVLIDKAHVARVEQVEEIKNGLDISLPYAYKLIRDAQVIYPSLEKVNKDFERARITQQCWKFIKLCETNKNARDAVQYFKLLIDVLGLKETEEEGTVSGKIVNVFRFSPDALGVKLPDNFDIEQYVQQLEKDYEQPRTIEIGKRKDAAS